MKASLVDEKNSTNKVWYGSTEEKKPSKTTDDRSRSIDYILTSIGEFGPYQWILDAIFFLMVTATSPYPVMMYFAGATSSWRCTSNSTTCLFYGTMRGDDDRRCNMPRSEWEYTEMERYSTVTQYDLSCERNWINYMTSSVFFIGWSFGAIVLGNIADNYGRRTVLLPSFFTSLVIGLVSPFIPNVFAFVFCRAAIGFLLPGVWVQTFVLISEVVGKQYRARAGQLIKFGHTTGYCMLGVVAYLVRNWKMLHVYCTAPFFVLVVTINFVPESMRWARLKGKPLVEAKTLRAMAEWNGKELPESVEKFTSPCQEEKVDRGSNIMDIFSTRKLMIKSLVQGYGWFALASVYYGLLLAAKNIGGNMYVNFILLSLADVPALGIGILLLGYFGRKKTVIGGMLLGGVCSIAIGLIPQVGIWTTVRVAFSMFGKCGVNMALNCMYTWSSELYPTSLRSIGLGFLQFTAHFGAAIAPWIAQALTVVSKAAPFIVMGALVITSALLSFLLNETKDIGMAESHHRESFENSDSDIQNMGADNKVLARDV